LKRNFDSSKKDLIDLKEEDTEFSKKKIKSVSKASNSSQKPSNIWLSKSASVDLDEIMNQLSTLQTDLRSKYKIYLEKLIELEALGEGTHGSVSRVFDKENRKFYALKQLKKPENKTFERFAAQAYRELKVLYEIHLSKNEDLLQLYAVEYDSEEDFSILMELGLGTLQDYFVFLREFSIPLGDALLQDVIYQIYEQICILRELYLS